MYRPLYGDEVANSIELGDEMEFPKPTEVLGRIAAQTAKQVIFQKVREAERENIFAEYNQRIGEVVNGTVKRFENGDIIVEIGRIEAVLPRKEQSRAESYTPGDRVRAVIKGVNRSAKGPQIVLSRTDPALLIKLFEQEVPEIYDGTVMIRGAVREAGDRAKVAVFSRERDVDPVGACVGMKGTRVQSIIRELRGEKIDIVEWSEDPIAFVTNALSPAKVQRVSIVDDRERVMEVVVEDKQLSLAIGKKGQNVRLAAKLTGWRIDIKSEEEKRREVEAQFEGLEAARRSGEAPRPTGEAAGARRRRDAGCPYTLAGVGEKTVRKLVDAGLRHRSRPSRPRRSSSCRRFRASASKTAEKILAAARGESQPSEATSGDAVTRRDAEQLERIRTSGGNRLATVRIYKVAELLGTTSQEVTALLKRDHGIEVKSASSTIEEVVGAPVRRAPRAAAQHHAAERRHLRRDAGRQGQEGRRRAKKAAEPPKPAAPALPPPRLVKTAKPVAVAAAEPVGRERRRRRRSRSTRRRRARSRRRRSSAGRRRTSPRADCRPNRRRRRRRTRTSGAARRRSRGTARAPQPDSRRAAAAPAAAPPPPRAGARPRRAADAAAAHRRPASDDADAAAADDAAAARGASARRAAEAGRAAAAGRRRRTPAAATPARVASRPAAAGAPGGAPGAIRPSGDPAAQRRWAVRVRCRRSRFGRSSPACRRGPGQYPQRPGMPSRPPYRQRPGGPGGPPPAQRRDPRAGAAADARRAAAGHAHHHARRRHDGEGPRRQARRAREGRARQAADEAADADHQLARSTPRPRR